MSRDEYASARDEAALAPYLNDETRIVLSGGAIIASASTALVFLVVFMLRGGLGDGLNAVIILCGYALLPIWLSLWAMNRYGKTPMSASVFSAAGLLAGVLLPLSGLAAGKYAGWLGMALLLATLTASIGAIGKGARTIGFGSLLVILMFAVLLLLSAGLQRLFLPEMMTLGLASSDSYFHTAIAQMILHFGIPSLGADGLVFQHYHTLSHALAAGYANASNASVPLVYLYWGGVILKAQLVWCFYCCIVLFSPGARWSRFTAITFGIVYAWLCAFLIGGLESEAFLLSLILLSALLPLLVTLMTSNGREAALSAGLAIACIGALACAGAKVSSGFFVAIALVVVGWNLRRQWTLLVVIATTLVALAILAYFALTPRDLTMSRTSMAIMLASYLQYLVPETVFSYTLPVGVALMLLRTSGLSSTAWDRAPRAVRWFLRADNLAKFLILATLACVTVLISSPIGSNMQYFSAILYAIALLILPATLYRMPHFAIAYKCSPAVIAVLLAASLMPLLSTLPTESFSTAVALYQKAEKPNNPVRISEDIKASLRQTHTPFARLRERISATPWAQFTQMLETENTRDGGILAVQIQPDAKDVWQRLKGGSPWWCMAPHLMIPAETGLFELRSAPPNQIENQCAPPGIIWYGFGRDQDAHRAGNLTDTQLCAMAHPAGIHKVYRLQSYRKLSENSIVPCS